MARYTEKPDCPTCGVQRAEPGEQVPPTSTVDTWLFKDAMGDWPAEEPLSPPKR